MKKMFCGMCKKEIPTNYMPGSMPEVKIRALGGKINRTFDICDTCCKKLLCIIEDTKEQNHDRSRW